MSVLPLRNRTTILSARTADEYLNFIPIQLIIFKKISAKKMTLTPHTILLTYMHDASTKTPVRTLTPGSSLDKAVKSNCFVITGIPSGVHKVQLIRLGISVGDKIVCLQRLPGGTIIIQKNRQEIAIGYHLAREISIRYI